MNGVSYKSGTVISAEQSHSITLTDAIGNESIYTFTIDKTPPTGTLTGVFNGGYTNKEVSFSWSESDATATLNGLRYTSGRTITDEGSNTVVLTDKAGNSTTYSFTIDTSAPVVGAVAEYASKPVTLTAQDKYSGVAAWEYCLNSGEVQRSESETLCIGGGAEANGIWTARAVDAVGNASGWVTVKYVCRESFGNSDEIYNSFTVPAYHVVTLSQKNFPSCYGSYTFADYDSALSFATAKEWACRVIPLDGGTSWNYLTATNENTRQIYTSIDELNAVIDKYARKLVGERKVIGQNGNVLNNPTDADGVTRADALTAQLTELPALLSEYSSLRYMLALSNSYLSTPARIVEGNSSSATICFISDGITLRKGAEKSLDYGIAFKNIIDEQGWYLITERDVCQNVERYLIYLDFEDPEVDADIIYGDGTEETVVFSKQYISENTAAMRYLRFEPRSLADNIDSFVMLSVSGRNLDAQYVMGDEMPVLCYENGYSGAYTVTAYDRSHNAVEFIVYIAGENPSLKHTSLTNEKQCTFMVQINDSHNAVSDIKLFKVFYDGTTERLYSDSLGTEVKAENLEYKMTVGGKYFFEFTDLYGRTVRTEPLFYEKGLPTATFKGVKAGGKTKNDVRVIYAADVTSELYKYDGGEWLPTSLYDETADATEKTLKITASPKTSEVYKILLYVTSDRNLFTEYTFEIDGIPPEVTVMTVSGAEVPTETVTTEQFYVTWTEVGYKAYYKRQGALSDSMYTKGTKITAEGTYAFSVYDEVNNELTFTVTLDCSVSYTLEGNYVIYGENSYITRNSFVFSMSEPWSVFNIDASNGQTVVNGQKLDKDGTYVVSVSDMYGNSLSLTLIVDKLPPVPVIETVGGVQLEDGARTREDFRVRCEEPGVSIFYSTDGSTFLAYDGSEIDTAGTHTFRLSDRINNVATVILVIDRELKYRVDGNYTLVDGVYYSQLWLDVVALETMSINEIVDGAGNVSENTKKITVEGNYVVRLCDVAGNAVEISLVIDKTAPMAQFETESGQIKDSGATVNEPFKLVCDEPNVKITYSFGGISVGAYDGRFLDETGSYTFTLTDFLGTSAELKIRISRTVAVRVDGVYVIDENGDYISKSWLSVSAEEEMAVFSITAEDGTTYDVNSKINIEGEYSFYAKDVIGNEAAFKLIIDKTAPEFCLDGVAANGATNSAVRVDIVDSVRTICQLNGGNELTISSGEVLEAEGEYVIKAYDLAGNFASVSFTIDKHVDIVPNIPLTYGQLIAGVVSFGFREPVTALLSRNGETTEYTRGEISATGDYTLEVTDECGNVVVCCWTIVPARSKSCELTVQPGYKVIAVLNSEPIDLPVIDGKIALNEDGAYSLKFESDEVSWWLELEIDNVAPTVEFENTRTSVKIFNPSKDNVRYELYRDGTLCSFVLNKSTEIKQTGNYRLICTDDVGNVMEYTFELHYIGDVTIVLISVVVALVIAGIVALVLYRLLRKIK